jgi:antiviral helicase SLH1
VNLTELQTVMLDSIHMLHAEYELAVTILLHIISRYYTKLIGLATSLNDATDLAKWLHVEVSNVLQFRSNDRDTSLAITAQAFHYSYSAALFRTMSKPLFSLLKSIPVNDQTLVFLPSHPVGRSVGEELLTRFALEEDSRGFIAHDVDVGTMALQLSGLNDRSLAELLLHGIGLYDGSQSRQDASMVLRLYAEGIIRVLLIHHKYRRGIPTRGNVIIFGTEYPTSSAVSKRTIVPYSMLELFEMQSRAARHGQSGIFHIFCPISARSTILRLLDDGLSLESQLLESATLRDWLRDSYQKDKIRNKQDALDLLASTYLALRLIHNPNYYGAEGPRRVECLCRVVDDIWDSEEQTKL